MTTPDAPQPLPPQIADYVHAVAPGMRKLCEEIVSASPGWARLDQLSGDGDNFRFVAGKHLTTAARNGLAREHPDPQAFNGLWLPYEYGYGEGLKILCSPHDGRIAVASTEARKEKIQRDGMPIDRHQLEASRQWITAGEAPQVKVGRSSLAAVAFLAPVSGAALEIEVKHREIRPITINVPPSYKEASFFPIDALEAMRGSEPVNY